MTSDTNSQQYYAGLAANIVAAHVSNNSIDHNLLPQLVKDLCAALQSIEAAPVAEPQQPDQLVPAVPIRASVKPDYIVCLEDGKKLKLLKRYLQSQFGLTPEQYRERWNLPADYPMVAPNYSAKRSQLAHEMNFGDVRARARRA